MKTIKIKKRIRLIKNRQSLAGSHVGWDIHKGGFIGHIRTYAPFGTKISHHIEIDMIRSRKRLNRKEVKFLIGSLASRFPKVTSFEGQRITGMRQSAKRYQANPSQATMDAIKWTSTKKIPKIVKKTIAKIKSSASKLANVDRNWIPQ